MLKPCRPIVRMPDDYLDANAICRTTFIRSVEIYETLGSTNDRATELARDPHVKLPALVAARNQTTGRGRGTNRWSAGEGALTLSVVLNPREPGVPVERLPQLSLAVGIAAIDALENELREKSELLAVKWPNDLILDDAKVGGILIETAISEKAQGCRAIIGVGINVNNEMSTFEPLDSQKLAAISLCQVTGRTHNLQGMVCRLMNAIDGRIQQLAVGDPQIVVAWRQKNWLDEQKVTIDTGNSRVSGSCIGIDDDGALLVAGESGLQRIISGTVVAAERIQSNR